METSGRLNLHRRGESHRFGFENQLTYRTYRENSAYTFANDFVRYNGKLFLQRQLGSDFFIRLTDRAEIVDFDQHTAFDYDYLRNDLWLRGSYERELTTSWVFGAGYRTRAVPDSTEIAYNGYAASVEFRRVSGINKQAFVTLTAERRVYADEEVRTPYYSIYSDATLSPVVWGRVGLKFDNTFETFVYDDPDEIYFNFVEDRMALRFMHYRSYYFSLGLGPTFGFLTSGDSPVDEYTEYGAKFSIDYGAGARIYVSGTYEPGYRDYRYQGDSSLDTIFSDFTYHRLSLFLTSRVTDGVTANVFASFEPEIHALSDDDATATVFSVDMSYGF